MKNALAIAFILIGFSAFSQKRPHQGIGLRLGDPVGISYKKYLPLGHSFEAILGSTSRNWHSAYYQNAFDDFSKYDGYTYQSHTIESTVYFQARYLFQYDIPIEGLFGKLDWYWGVGGVLKVAKVKYRYANPLVTPASQSDVKTDFDLGPEAILGMEYLFQDVPIALFGEASFAIEIVDRPGAFSGFGAIGIRYNFR